MKKFILIISGVLVLSVVTFVGYESLKFRSCMKKVKEAGSMSSEEMVDFSFKVAEAYRALPAVGSRMHEFCHAILQLEIRGIRDKEMLLDFATHTTISSKAAHVPIEKMADLYASNYIKLQLTSSQTDELVLEMIKLSGK